MNNIQYNVMSLIILTKTICETHHVLIIRVERIIIYYEGECLSGFTNEKLSKLHSNRRFMRANKGLSLVGP